MFKVILFDADGVVIAKRQKYFSDRLVDDFGVTPEDAIDFVKNALSPAMKGKLDLKQELPLYLKKWNIEKSVDEMFDYWWSAENKVNDDVITVVDQLRQKGIKCYLASDQEKNRGIYIMNGMGLRQHFDGAFVSYELGLQKHDKEFFEKVLEELKVNPDEVFYWDDDQKNVDIAQSVGITSRYYSDYDSFAEEMKSLGVL